jgi:hypothetical protein
VSALVFAAWIFSLVMFSFFLLYNLATLALTGLSLTRGRGRRPSAGTCSGRYAGRFDPASAWSCRRTTSGP